MPSVVFLLPAALLKLIPSDTANRGTSLPSSGTKAISNQQCTLQVPADYDPNKEYKLIFGFY
ncbi:hypothetical protein EST38_g11754 [Candolleomyces aberdarensis]|uniref:Uncharacterized protein n=1 Tax=Candolleomyces aberdarensis TaxID=2316362 RepID=A0A4Q2D428_9AGAR|nr:hypothetical protein EST38_g11754 [Candolleomyces aberdarensis]